MGSVGRPPEVRALDLQLLLDLLTIEADPERWQTSPCPSSAISRTACSSATSTARCNWPRSCRTRRRMEGPRKPAAAAALTARRGRDDDAGHVPPAIVDDASAEQAQYPVLSGGAVDRQGRSPRRSRSRKRIGHGSDSRRSFSGSERPERTSVESCVRRRIQPSGEPRFTCCASSVEPRLCRI